MDLVQLRECRYLLSDSLGLNNMGGRIAQLWTVGRALLAERDRLVTENTNLKGYLIDLIQEIKEQLRDMEEGDE